MMLPDASMVRDPRRFNLRMLARGPDQILCKARQYLMGGGVCLAIGIILLSTTYEYARRNLGMLTVYTTFFCLAVYCFMCSYQHYRTGYRASFTDSEHEGGTDDAEEYV